MRLGEALATLQLREGASLAEVRKAYLRLARLAHPDLAPPEQRLAAERQFKTLQQAYDLATEQGRRALALKYQAKQTRVNNFEDLQTRVKGRRAGEDAAFRAARSFGSSGGPGRISVVVVLAIFATPFVVAAPFMKRRYEKFLLDPYSKPFP